jgi:hypothetical protein
MNTLSISGQNFSCRSGGGGTVSSHDKSPPRFRDPPGLARADYLSSLQQSSLVVDLLIPEDVVDYAPAIGTDVDLTGGTLCMTDGTANPPN